MIKLFEFLELCDHIWGGERIEHVFYEKLKISQKYFFRYRKNIFSIVEMFGFVENFNEIATFFFNGTKTPEIVFIGCN